MNQLCRKPFICRDAVLLPFIWFVLNIISEILIFTYTGIVRRTHDIRIYGIGGGGTIVYIPFISIKLRMHRAHQLLLYTISAFRLLADIRGHSHCPVLPSWGSGLDYHPPSLCHSTRNWYRGMYEHQSL